MTTSRASADLRAALEQIAFNDGVGSLAGDPSLWPSEIAYVALGGRHKHGQRIDSREALSAPAEPADKPVAWQYLCRDGKWVGCDKPSPAETRDEPERYRSLYTTPQPAPSFAEVKPLHWIRSNVFGSYKWRGMSEQFGEIGCFTEVAYSDEQDKQIEEKKAAIQADYEQRIRTAIASLPPAPPQERVDEEAVCCSSITPCEHQRTHPNGVCEACLKAFAKASIFHRAAEFIREHDLYDESGLSKEELSILAGSENDDLEECGNWSATDPISREQRATVPQLEPWRDELADASPPVSEVDAEAVKEKVQFAIDLLLERVAGSPARSSSHNARVVLETALSLLKGGRHAK